MNNIIYLDNAATTFPKPESVHMATIECMENYCGNAGRGSHPLAMMAAEKVFEAREKVAGLFSSDPTDVVFTYNTTYALNMAIKGVMRSGGHVLISNMEHNSVLRPVAKLAREGRISYDVFKLMDKGKALGTKEIISDIISKLRPDTKMIVCIHASNICSYVSPIREIGALCRRHKLLFAVDAAQSAGHLPISMPDDNVDILCLPSHKGLYSPQGCGIMLLSRGLSVDTLVEGGNGMNSLEASMGNISPERYEGGTLCIPSIAGLCAGIDFINQMGIDAIADHEKKLFCRARDALLDMQGITVYAPEHEGSVLFFNLDGMDADIVGGYLGERGFCLRSGYHCSALAHRALGTSDVGGVRIGLGIFNNENEIDKLLSEINKLTLR
jgi:cysteine desulfurase family protein